jgi:DNA-directed RNA polymerase subunit M/transcription elongation factor TFIIS
MPPIVSSIVLTQKGEIKQVRITIPESGLTLADITAKVFKRKESAEVLGTYPIKGATLHLVGYTKGRAGFENKHELPPPLDEKLFFGDILILASKSEESFSSPHTFKAEEYEAFYKKMFGDFEDLDEEEGEEEEEEEEEVEEEVEVAPEEDVETEIVAEYEEEEAPPRKSRKRKVDTSAALQTMKYDPKDRLHLESGTGVASVLHPNRLNVLRILEKIFKDEYLLSKETQVQIERAIYNGAIRRGEKRGVPLYWKDLTFIELYTSRARQILGNLSPTSYVKNTEFFDTLKNGRISFEELEMVDSYEIFPSKWKAAFEFQQMVEKRQLEGNKSIATDKFTCARCWKKECTYYEMQTRSADEPMTIFINCLNCGKHWRQ